MTLPLGFIMTSGWVQIIASNIFPDNPVLFPVVVYMGGSEQRQESIRALLGYHLVFTDFCPSQVHAFGLW
jgi:hypothetical protein